MNSQTITSKANAKHFSQAATPKTPAETKTSRVKAEAAATPENHVHQGNGKDGEPAKAGATAAAPHHEASTAGREIQFHFEAPSAKEVLLAADFTNWEKQPVKLIKGGGGIWHTKMSLAPGKHSYRFLVDGVWQDDPKRTERVANPYGTANSVIEVH